MPIPPEVILQLETERRLLEEKVFEHESRIKQISEIINHAKKLSINWSAKAMNCLRGSDEPMTTDEILRCVFRDDLAELECTDRRRNYIMQLSVALNRLCAKDLVIGKNLEGYKGKLYYLKKWENNEGNLRPEHLYYYNQKIKRIKIERNRNQFV